MALPREVDFASLSARGRARLVECLRGQGVPAPIFAEASTGESVAAALALGLLGAVLLAVVVLSGWDVDTRAAVAGVARALWVLGVYLVALAVVRILSARARRGRLPWTPGRYLFPACVVDAREDPLRVVSLAELADVDVKTQELTQARGIFYQEVCLRFEGGHTETFCLVARPELLRRAEVDGLVSVRDRLRAARDGGDASALRDIDPFADVPRGGATYRDGGEKREEAEAPRVRAAPRWTSAPHAIALLGAAVVVAPIALVVLPARAVATAEDREGVEGLRRARRAWPLPWTRAAIDARTRARYEQVVADFRSRHRGADPRALATVTAMVAELERRATPVVPARVDYELTDAVDRADAAAARAAGVKGGVPGTCALFLGSGFSPAQERDLVTAVDRALGLPGDVLAFDLPPATEGVVRAIPLDDDSLALRIRYRFRFTGSLFHDPGSHVYPAVTAEVTVTLRASTGESFTATTTLDLPETFEATDLGAVSDLHQQQAVYGRMTAVMVAGAGDRFARALRGPGAP